MTCSSWAVRCGANGQTKVVPSWTAPASIVCYPLKSRHLPQPLQLIDIDSVTASPDVWRTMVLRHPEFTTPETVRVSVGTWNVNGGKHFRSITFQHEHLTDWLLDMPKLTQQTRPGTCPTSQRLCCLSLSLHNTQYYAISVYPLQNCWTLVLTTAFLQIYVQSALRK